MDDFTKAVTAEIGAPVSFSAGAQAPSALGHFIEAR
tara:strand:- start:698 stop:805 length:108 start_codon:yes stop_codon:yes gene_type:complete